MSLKGEGGGSTAADGTTRRAGDEAGIASIRKGIEDDDDGHGLCGWCNVEGLRELLLLVGRAAFWKTRTLSKGKPVSLMDSSYPNKMPHHAQVATSRP